MAGGRKGTYPGSRVDGVPAPAAPALGGGSAPPHGLTLGTGSSYSPLPLLALVGKVSSLLFFKLKVENVSSGHNELPNSII